MIVVFFFQFELNFLDLLFQSEIFIFDLFLKRSAETTKRKIKFCVFVRRETFSWDKFSRNFCCSSFRFSFIWVWIQRFFSSRSSSIVFFIDSASIFNESNWFSRFFFCFSTSWKSILNFSFFSIWKNFFVSSRKFSFPIEITAFLSVSSSFRLFSFASRKFSRFSKKRKKNVFFETKKNRFFTRFEVFRRFFSKFSALIFRSRVVWTSFRISLSSFWIVEDLFCKIWSKSKKFFNEKRFFKTKFSSFSPRRTDRTNDSWNTEKNSITKVLFCTKTIYCSRKTRPICFIFSASFDELWTKTKYFSRVGSIFLCENTECHRWIFWSNASVIRCLPNNYFDQFSLSKSFRYFLRSSRWEDRNFC